MTNGDMDFVDGYDDLPEELQEKVKRAIEQGHVDDEDWKHVRTYTSSALIFAKPTRIFRRTYQVLYCSRRRRRYGAKPRPGHSQDRSQLL